MLNLGAMFESKSSQFGSEDKVVVILEGFEERQEFSGVSTNLLLKKFGGGSRSFGWFETPFELGFSLALLEA